MGFRHCLAPHRHFDATNIYNLNQFILLLLLVQFLNVKPGMSSQAHSDAQLTIVERALSAAGAAFISAVIVNPLDVAKVLFLPSSINPINEFFFKFIQFFYFFLSFFSDKTSSASCWSSLPWRLSNSSFFSN